MDQDEFKLMAVQSSLNRMFKSSFFDICTIDQAIKILEVIPDHQSYDILRTLHCVSYKDMEPELYRQLPALIQRTVGGPIRHGVLLTNDDQGKSLCIVPGKPIVQVKSRVGFFERLIGRS